MTPSQIANDVALNVRADIRSTATDKMTALAIMNQHIKDNSGEKDSIQVVCVQEVA